MQESVTTGLAASEFFARVSQRLTLTVPDGLTDPGVIPARGDHDVDPVMRKIAEVRPIRPAAVLVPVIDHAEPSVLLTQRAQHLPDRLSRPLHDDTRLSHRTGYRAGEARLSVSA